MIGFLSLGTNLGDKKKNLDKALALLEDFSNLKIIKTSGYYETDPWGGVVQDSFLNLAAEIESDVDPWELLEYCQQVEDRMGRVRSVRWGPRIIDIDILTYHNYIINNHRLVLPHPYMEQREFVLAPLREIHPNMVLPSGKSIQEIRGEGKVKKISFT